MRPGHEIAVDVDRAELFCCACRNQVYELVPIDMGAGEHKKEPFISLNPFGQVPAFEDGDLKLFDLLCIELGFLPIIQIMIHSHPIFLVIVRSYGKQRAAWPYLVLGHLRFSQPPNPPAKPTTTTIHTLSSCSSSSQKWRAKVSFFPAFLNKRKDTQPLKDELLDAIAPLDRGADATPEDQQTVDQIARKLEAVNPTKEPLKSDLLNGKWELIYTTSKSILQAQRPKILRSKVNYQAINADTLRAQNMESWPTFNQVLLNTFVDYIFGCADQLLKKSKAMRAPNYGASLVGE